MRRMLGTALMLLAVATAAQAHFVFIVPQEGTRKAQVVFSDELAPDRAELLKKIAHTTYRISDGKGSLKPIKATRGEAAFVIEAPDSGPTYIIGHCPYGVIDKGKEPFLLTYQARAVVMKAGETLPEAPAHSEGLVVVPQQSGKEVGAVKVLWQGKPLAEAEVALYVPGEEKAVSKKTDEAGLVALTPAAKAGWYGVRARHMDNKKGELGGKPYASARTYATLVFPVAAGRKSAAGAGESSAATADREKKPAENPEASKLLADARAARANWANFPGFTADAGLNVDGKVVRGKLRVTGNGKVELDLPDAAKEPVAAWARRTLGSIVSHRHDDVTSLKTPCTFTDDVADHPLGRAIRLLNDEHHSSYRVRDQQIIEVNRSMGEVRFTITVLENRLNAERKYLPVSFVVNTWDVKTGALRSSESHHNTWTRLGKYDLPVTITVVTAGAGRQVTRKIELTRHELMEK